MLNRKTLADLACWEPHTFKALTDIAKESAVRNELDYTKSITMPKILLGEKKKKF